jgi:hypothetical protein
MKLAGSLSPLSSSTTTDVRAIQTCCPNAVRFAGSGSAQTYPCCAICRDVDCRHRPVQTGRRLRGLPVGEPYPPAQRAGVRCRIDRIVFPVVRLAKRGVPSLTGHLSLGSILNQAGVIMLRAGLFVPSQASGWGVVKRFPRWGALAGKPTPATSDPNLMLYVVVSCSIQIIQRLRTVRWLW